MWQNAPANIDLITGIFTLLSDNLNCMRNWGFYLFSPEFNREVELRNKIGTLWIASLLDSVEGEARELNRYRARATAQGLTHLQSACDQVATFIEAVKEILGLYSREEQFFLSYCRDQFAHSWLARRHSQKSKFKYFDGNRIVIEELSIVDHEALIRPFFTTNGLDETLSHLLSRFRNLNLRYWHVVVELAAPGTLQQIQETMIQEREFQVNALMHPVVGLARFSFN